MIYKGVGVNVITNGNHIWDEKEILDIIDKEKRLIRPENLFEGQPEKWIWNL